MIFEIDFNQESDDKTLERLGAKLINLYEGTDETYDVYKLEVNTFEEL